MNSSIFTTSNVSINASLVSAIGPVQEIPADIRKGEATHSFKIITVIGPLYGYYKSEESAKNSRSALNAMIERIRHNVFRSAQYSIPSESIVGFSRVFALNTDAEYTFSFKVNILTCSEKDSVVWLKYQSEDHAMKARKAIYAAVQAVNRVVPDAEIISEGTVDTE